MQKKKQVTRKGSKQVDRIHSWKYAKKGKKE